MGRKNLSIIFSKVRQLPLPSGGGLGELVVCGELEQEQVWFFRRHLNNKAANLVLKLWN